jgi:hypothetical protein
VCVLSHGRQRLCPIYVRYRKALKELNKYKFLLKLRPLEIYAVILSFSSALSKVHTKRMHSKSISELGLE